MMLQNACIRYDESLRQKPSPTPRAVYQHDIADDDPPIYDDEEDYLGDDLVSDGIDIPSDDMYNVHQTNFNDVLMSNHLFLGTPLKNSNLIRIQILNPGLMVQSTSQAYLSYAQ